MKTVNMILSLAFVAAASSALAEDAAPVTEKRDAVVKGREALQEKRIEQGEKNGSLTKGEEKRLEGQQKRVEKMEANAMKDGKMTKGEFKRIERAQNRASNNIEHKKHNGRHQ